MFSAQEFEWQNSTPYGTGAYWDQEAQMGARWMVEDGKPCPCNGTGYLTTSVDTFVRCGNGCPAGRHPLDDEMDGTDADYEYNTNPNWRSLVDTLEAYI